MSEPVARALEALSKLRASDRRAILARLSDDERRQLARLSAASQRSASSLASDEKLDLPPCSPWLAKHLKLVLDGPDATSLTTAATRDALRQMVTQHETAQHR